MTASISITVGALAAAAAGALAWRRFAPTSWWYAAGFPVTVVRVYATWGHVASGCGLSRRRRRWRWTFDGLPGLGGAAFAPWQVTQRRRPQRVLVERPPRLGLVRPTALGFRVPVRLHDGQTPDDYTAALSNLSHAWRVHAVRLAGWRPGKVTLLATRGDPLARVSGGPADAGLLRARVGVLETGEPWLVDFRAVPHWLNTGATNSGKSTLANALLVALAPQPVALVGFDLKGGVEFTPYQARLSALASDRAECVQLLTDLVTVVRDRMRTCRTRRVRNIWKLPDEERPVPVVVLVDEVAELFLMADKAEKDEVASTATQLLRLAQLGRAFGVYLFVCGQRVGSDLGPGVTALRSQLSGRVCHRVNDDETAKMTLGDMDPAALEVARRIPAESPGVAVVIAGDGRWHRARSAFVTEEQAEAAAHAHARLAPAWRDLIAGVPAGQLTAADLDEFTEPGDPGEPEDRNESGSTGGERLLTPVGRDR